jgi:hypothetical protein
MKSLIIYIGIFLFFFQFGCDTLDSNNVNTLSDVELNVSGLSALSDSLEYVGWLASIDNNASDTIAHSYKIFAFSVDANLNYSEKVNVNFGYIHDSNAFLISEELKAKTDSSISKNKIDMYGRLFNNNSNLDYIGKNNTNPRPSGSVQLLVDVVK